MITIAPEGVLVGGDTLGRLGDDPVPGAHGLDPAQEGREREHSVGRAMSAPPVQGGDLYG
jgi:hypothetical protein